MIRDCTRYPLLLLSIAWTNHLSAQSINHWETIIQTGDNCQYFIPQQDIGSNWITKNFDDSGWASAQSGVGYGDDDDNTTTGPNVPSVYIRYSFNVEQLAQIASLVLDMDYDDGFIAYLNGVEIARANVENPVSWNMELRNNHEATMYSGGRPERFNIAQAVNEILTVGENVLAVEVHNRTANSSDLSSNVFLHAGITETETIYSDTPDWFWAPIVLTDSHLPIMVIHTNGQTIPDEPRIVADMGLINNGIGQTNAASDAWNEYTGKISIEIRGESSQLFEKKSFSIYFYKENDTDGGELVAGPPWDYNIAYGNIDYGHGHNIPETYRWLYDQGSRVYWWERLMEDETYKNRVYCRWRKFMIYREGLSNGK